MYHISIAPDRVEAFSDKLALCRALGVVNLELTGTLDGVPFADLPEDWLCPRCRRPKEKFNRA